MNLKSFKSSVAVQVAATAGITPAQAGVILKSIVSLPSKGIATQVAVPALGRVRLVNRKVSLRPYLSHLNIIKSPYEVVAEVKVGPKIKEITFLGMHGTMPTPAERFQVVEQGDSIIFCALEGDPVIRRKRRKKGGSG